MRIPVLAGLVWLAASAAAPAQTASDDAALVVAAKGGDAARVAALLDAGADANAAEANGSSALLWASHYDHADIVRALLDAGADASEPNTFGASPIGEAAKIADAEILELLIDAGADPNWASREGQTPLMTVARTGRTDAAQVLLDAGAEVNAVEQWGGQSALMWATSQNNPDMVELLLDHGADPDMKSVFRNWQRRVTVEPRKKIMADGGLSPLHYAARENCIDCARALIAAGADIDIEDPDRVTPLVMAVMNRHFDLAAMLIEAGADIDKWDFAGRTPLYVAVDMNTPPFFANGQIDDDLSARDLVAMLLERGANPNIQLKRRPQYRSAVTERGADIMLSAGAAPLMRAARSADLEVMRMLLDAGAIADLPNQFGVTPFMVAAGVGFGVRATRGIDTPEARRIEAMDMLLQAGADINRRTLSQGRIPPEGKDNFIYRVQITEGNQRYIMAYVPPDGRIALHGAAINGFTDAVRWLVDHGSDIDVIGADGLSALDLARGDYRDEYLAPPAEPFPATIAALEDLCAAKPGCAFPEPEDQAALAQ